ncbi:MAG: SGNH/GDSL hydrolase family protein [Eubacteriales bacterium]
MESVVRNNFAVNIGSVRFKGIDAVASEEPPVIPKVYEREVEGYLRLNEFAVKDGIVLFGSTFAKEIPVGELRQAFDLNCNIYNRSFTDLSVFDAEALSIRCAESLEPEKIILQLGETDLERGYKSVPEIISAYDSLVKNIKKRNRHTEIVIVSVCENANGVQPAVFNSQLEDMAKKNKCKFADISAASGDRMPVVKAFSLLKRFMRNGITFCDAVNMINY